MKSLRRFLPVLPHQLGKRGILGMNKRNADFTLPCNPRKLYPRVDDKLETKKISEANGIPVPQTIGVISRYGEVADIAHHLHGHEQFVIKPAQGAAGRGIIVVIGRNGERFTTAGREELDVADIKYHVAAILSGLYSLGGVPDKAIIEQRILPHERFNGFCVKGTPDIRIILYHGSAAMAMSRLPTTASRGRANLHQGAVGVGIDLSTGITTGGVYLGKRVLVHPDTNRPVGGFVIPEWTESLFVATKLAAALELGYLGVDLVIDAARGPLVLEANARPGLVIQVANQVGLLPRLQSIQAQSLVRPGASADGTPAASS